MATRLQVTFDAVDPHALCASWAAVVHDTVEDHSAVTARSDRPRPLPPQRPPTRRSST